MAVINPGNKTEHRKSIQEQKARILAGIHSRQYTPTRLPQSLYLGTANILKHALYKGYGSPLLKYAYNSPDYNMLYELRTNVFMFSAAKTFQQTLAMSEKLTDGDRWVSFEEFRDGFINSAGDKVAGAADIFDRYNEDYLDTEYNTAIAASRTASKWTDAESEKHLFPYLTYVAVMDEHTCEICAPLDGITLPVDDPFWDENACPQHFNCECVFEQVEQEEGESKEWEDKDVDEAVEKSQETKNPMFNFNPGKDKTLFMDTGKYKHPYFEVSQAYKDLAANNFNLAIPETEDGVKLPMPKDNIDRDETLIGEDKELQERSIAQFLANKDELIDKYLADPDNGGNIVNTDNARKLFDGYNGTNASAVHEASSALSKAVEDKLLAEGNENIVNGFAGGSGAGKTTTILDLFPGAAKADMILDANMSSLEKVYKNLKIWWNKGNDVNLFYVYRNPVDAWVNGVIKRMMGSREAGRVVPMDVFLKNTAGSLNVFQTMIEKGYGDIKGLKIKIIDNSLGKGNAGLMDLDKFKNLELPQDLRAQLIKKTDEIYWEGKITKEQYQTLVGDERLPSHKPK